MQLNIDCDVDSFSLNYSNVNYEAPTGRLTALPTIDPGDLTFRMDDITNAITGCPITKVDLCHASTTACSYLVPSVAFDTK